MKTSTKRWIYFALAFVVALSLFSTIFMTDDWEATRKKGRDAGRVRDIKQLQAALELYANECGGFPDVPNATIIGSSSFDTSFHDGCPEGITMSKYMKTFPISPLPRNSKWDKFASYIFNRPIPGGEPYRYCSTASTDSLDCFSSSQSYIISFSLEGQVGSLLAGKHVATPKEVR